MSKNATTFASQSSLEVLSPKNKEGLKQIEETVRYQLQDDQAAQGKTAGYERSVQTENLVREEPVALVFDKDHKIFGTCTPIDLEDYAYGMCFDRGIISQASQILSLNYELQDVLHLINVELDPSIDIEQAFKNFADASATPLFKSLDYTEGLNTLHQYKLASPPSGIIPLKPQLIIESNEKFYAMQELNKHTGSTHAAAFVNWEGEVLLVREDLARHCGLTKLIGACLRAEISADQGFVFLSSRCAVELALKLAKFGVCLIATVSAPSYSTCCFARANDMTVASYVRDGRFTLYSGAHRIALQPAKGIIGTIGQ